MRAARAKILCVMTTAIVITGLLSPSISAADELQATQQQFQDLQQNKQKQVQHISQLKSQENTLGTQIQDIENQLAVTNNKITDLEQQIAKKDDEIKQMQDTIQKTQDLLQQRDNLLKQRIRVMYESGTTSYLDVILSSTSFSDFIDRLSALSMIADQDKQILDSIKQQKAALQQQQAGLLKAQQQKEQAHSQLLVMRQLQDKQKAQKQATLTQVHSSRLAEEKKMQEEQAAMNQLANQIQAILQARAAAQAQAAQAAQAGSSSQQQGSGSWLWPLPDSHTISSNYGWRDLFGGRDFHAGIDIAAPIGTKIEAVADGDVLFAGPASGYGHWIVILHSNGLMSIYGHMYGNELYVSPGQHVKAGQVIAAVGSDGEATGPHLHFAVANGITNGRMDCLNPWNYLK